jgi:hypothetical protein
MRQNVSTECVHPIHIFIEMKKFNRADHFRDGLIIESIAVIDFVRATYVPSSV